MRKLILRTLHKRIYAFWEHWQHISHDTPLSQRRPANLVLWFALDLIAIAATVLLLWFCYLFSKH